MMVKGPRFLSVSSLKGLVVWKYLALTKAWSLILKSSVRVHLVSAGPWFIVVQQPSPHGGIDGGSQDQQSICELIWR